MMQTTTFRRVLDVFRPYWQYCLLIILSIMMMTVLGTVSPVLMGMIFGSAFQVVLLV